MDIWEARYWAIIDAIATGITNEDIENETLNELVNAIYLIRKNGVKV